MKENRNLFKLSYLRVALLAVVMIGGLVGLYETGYRRGAEHQDRIWCAALEKNGIDVSSYCEKR